jgi:anti-sigma factor RsiW
MNCRQAERHLPGYLDGGNSPANHAALREHLTTCADCQLQLERYRRLSVCLANVHAAVPPADLALRIRIRASQHVTPAARLQKIWSTASLTFENILKPLAVPATGGILTALLVFVLVAHNILVGVPMGIVPNDLPLNLVQPARLESLAPFPLPGSSGNSGDSGAAPLLLEATLNAQGQVVSYRILAGPSDQAVLRQIDQVMMFSHFRPETSFGRPQAGGRVLLSFSEVRVHG